MTGTDHKILLNRLLAGKDLSSVEMEEFFGAVMDGDVGNAVIAAMLVALRAKTETGPEVAAAARAMRARSLAVEIADPGLAVDTCGTGGDGAETINISTAAALLAAAAGAPVAKHGNRSVSSRCGSADVLEAAGVRLDQSPEDMAALHDEIGITFLFAPRLHPAMAAVMPVRRTLGVRTVFNLLGPLTNPAGVERQVVGVWGREVQTLMASALADLGARYALVVHSDDGLDEISVSAPTTVIEVRDGDIAGEWRIDPGDLGIAASDPESLRGGDAAENALMVAGLAGDLQQGLDHSREVLRSGAALEILEELARRSADTIGDV